MARLGSVIHQLTPPILTSIAARKGNQQIFPSYEAALAACGSSYDDDEVARVVAAKTELFRRSLQSPVPELDLGAMRTLVGLACAKSPSGTLRVLDFGGACGYHYFIARLALGEGQALDWRVVETPAMVHAASELASRELSFFTSISEAVESWQEPPELVFASGVVQCVSEPLEVCRSLVDIGAETLFITRTGLSEDETTRAIVHHSSLSSNGPGPLPRGFADKAIRYPTTFVPATHVEKVVESRYHIVARVIEDVGTYRAGRTPINMFGYLGRRR